MIRIQPKNRIMLMGQGVSLLLVGLALPTMRHLTIASASSRLVAVEMILVSVSTMAISHLWERIEPFVTRWYVPFKVAELVMLLPFYLYFILDWSPVAYYLADIIYYVLFTQVMYKGYSVLRTRLFPTPYERVTADTALEFVTSLSSLIGYILSIMLTPSPTLCLALLLLSDIASILSKVITFSLHKPM